MWDTFLYIPLTEDSKRPSDSWDGWPISPEHENVYTYGEILSHDWDYWAIVGNRDQNLLIIDLDLYKMGDPESIYEGWDDLLDMSPIVRTPAVNKKTPGLHVYVTYDGDEIPETIDYVDLKGDVGKGFCVSPVTPGYEIVHDPNRLVNVDLETLKRLPVFFEATKPKDSKSTYKAGIPYVDYVPEPHDNPPTWVPLDIPALDWLPPCIRDGIRNYDGDDPMTVRLIVKFFEAWGYDKDLVERLQEFNDNFTRTVIRNCGLGSPSVYHLISRAEYSEEEYCPHPFHGSDSGNNFKVDAGGETFRCWRHDITGNVFHLIGLKEGLANGKDYEFNRADWSAIMEAAEDYPFVDTFDGSCSEIKDEGLCPVDCGRFPSPMPL